MTRNVVATEVEVGMVVYPYDDYKHDDRTWFEVEEVALRDGNEIVFNGEHIFQRDDHVEVQEDPDKVLVDRKALEAYVNSSDGEKWPQIRRVFEKALGIRTERTYRVTIDAVDGHDTVLHEALGTAISDTVSIKWESMP